MAGLAGCQRWDLAAVMLFLVYDFNHNFPLPLEGNGVTYPLFNNLATCMPCTEVVLELNR